MLSSNTDNWSWTTKLSFTKDDSCVSGSISKRSIGSKNHIFQFSHSHFRILQEKKKKKKKKNKEQTNLSNDLAKLACSSFC